MEALIINPTSLVTSFGYVAIFLLSVAQSCCVPTSSELTLGFAGALAATGRLSLPAAILAGASGEVVGAYLAWVIGRTAGRAIVDRYGRYVLLTQHDLDRAEAWYARHERWGVFGGRLVPVIRNFVALPAGVAEVPLVSFGLLTAAGSLIWDGAMAGIGYGVGRHWHEIVHLFSDAGYLIAVLAVIAIVFLFVHRWRSYEAQVRAANIPSGTEAGGGQILGAGTSNASAGTSNASAATDLAHRPVRAGGGGAPPTELPSPKEEILSLIERLAEPGRGVGRRDGAAANERVTAAAGAVLFVLIFFEGVTLLKIRSLLTPHVIIGLVLIPPVMVKLASTAWRFARYYSGRVDYVRKGPPRPLLRVLAPFLVLTTVVLFASGVALVVVKSPAAWLYTVHRDDFILWFVILAVHVAVYMWQVPGILRRDISSKRRFRRTSPSGRLVRLWLVSGSVVAGVILAVIVWPSLASQVNAFRFH